jgi:tetratricopeptide (TPR) repeat protein
VVDQVRLFRNRPEHRWRYRVHEQILPALRRARADVCPTDICIEHAGYQDPGLTRAKLERNRRLLELEYQEQPDDPFTRFNLGLTYQGLGRHAEALPHLHQSLKLSQPGDSIYRKLFALLAAGHIHLGQPREALAACRAGRARFPDDGDLLFLEGQLLRAHGDLGGTERCLLRLREPEVGGHLGSRDTGLRGFKGRHELALVYKAVRGKDMGYTSGKHMGGAPSGVWAAPAQRYLPLTSWAALRQRTCFAQ